MGGMAGVGGWDRLGGGLVGPLETGGYDHGCRLVRAVLLVMPGRACGTESRLQTHRDQLP